MDSERAETTQGNHGDTCQVEQSSPVNNVILTTIGGNLETDLCLPVLCRRQNLQVFNCLRQTAHAIGKHHLQEQDVRWPERDPNQAAHPPNGSSRRCACAGSVQTDGRYLYCTNTVCVCVCARPV